MEPSGRLGKKGEEKERRDGIESDHDLNGALGGSVIIPLTADQRCRKENPNGKESF